MNKLFPNVTSKKELGGTFNVNFPIKAFMQEKEVNVFTTFNQEYEFVDKVNEANLVFIKDDTLAKEAYQLALNENVITINYKTFNGAFYAMQTLKQILANSSIPNMIICDEPAMEIRGFMFDISRDKVAKIETIKEVIDLMADLKMNHFELYVEGFSFEYKSFPEYLEKDGYISVDEYKELEKYCNDRFIDMVPNENGFGHMQKWLETKEYHDLAICPDGINLWGRFRKPTTVNPLDERSFELVKKMYKDMIPNSNSKFFNMNFDEPFELGKGKTEGNDVEDLYVDYMLKCYEEIKKYNKTPMIWGDVLVKHPHAWDRIPKDMYFIDWGYDAPYSFDKHAKDLKAKNVKFMAAPATTSWCSFHGRFLDWFENIENAVDSVVKYDGKGVILTDWGDFGHLQFLSCSYAPLVYMGLYSWSKQEGVILNVREYLNKFIFDDKNKIIGDLLMSLGEYSRYETEYGFNGTKTFYRFMWACCSIMDKEKNPIEYYKTKMGQTALPKVKYNLLNKFFDLKLAELESCDIKKDLITKDEIKQNIKLVRFIEDLGQAYNDENTTLEKISYLNNILNSKEEFINDQKRIWLTRNKEGGLKSSLSYIEYFMEFTKITLDNLKK